MKRSIFFTITGVTLFFAVSCQKTELPENAKIIFNIAAPVDVISTKGAVAIDTNSFILTIRNVNGAEVYKGLYGARPEEIVVSAGTYEISVVSELFDSPEFEKPCYGDEKVIVVSNGQTANVAFLCKLTNACMNLSFTERFIKKYGDSGVNLKQGENAVLYAANETRSLYFEPGNVEFSVGDEPLFNRVLKAGEFHNLQLDASNNESESSFSIAVDTTSNAINETIIVGEDNGGANGQSAQTAMSIESAFEHVGDTLWVWGYIVGTSVSTTKFNMTPPFETDAHLALAERVEVSERSEICPVELSKKALKDALGLATNPDNLKKRITIRGVVVESYFGSKGIKSVSDYQLQE